MAVDCSIRLHDRRQVEVKLSYPLDRSMRRQTIAVDLFLFFPYQIAIDAENYPPAQFYNDLHVYTRFKTPEIPFADLLNPENPDSPLTRIERSLSQSPAADEAFIRYELKTLATIVRAQLRDTSKAIMARSDEANALSPDDVAAVGQLADRTSAVLERVRTLGDRIRHAGASHPTLETLTLTDEYMRIQAERRLLDLAIRIQAAPATDNLNELLDRLKAQATHEAAYRRSRGYPSLSSATDPRGNEEYLYREGLLKKFCAQVLFLSVEQRSGGRRATHFLEAVAAGGAMALGLVLLWFAARNFPQQTLAFGVAAVLAYVIRDRVKLLAQEYGHRLVPRWFCDRTGRLIERQQGTRIGATRETTRWVRRDEVPSEILDLRRHRDPFAVPIREETETILHYAKALRFETGTVRALHPRASAIDDILRLHVGGWLGRMDDPEKTRAHLDAADGPVMQVRAGAIYHVNALLRLASDAGETVVHKARLVLTQNGLVRIERNT